MTTTPDDVPRPGGGPVLPAEEWGRLLRARATDPAAVARGYAQRRRPPALLSQSDTDTRSLARAVAIASGLGTTSAFTWLKMPSSVDAETVFSATTLPCVVLGGVPSPDPAADLASWGHALVQPTVRGLVVGRALLDPPDGDVATAVEAAARVLRAAHLAEASA